MTTEALLYLHVAATLMMTGLIWFVQVVHYPLFARVPAVAFTAYERAHTERTGWLVAPLMGIEAVTASVLLVFAPAEMNALLPAAGLALLAVIWTSTIAIQVPQHRNLLEGFSATVVDRLAGWNWLRTSAWSGRAVVALMMLT